MSDVTTRPDDTRPRFPVARALWRMIRPDQVALIVLVYAFGVLVALARTGIGATVLAMSSDIPVGWPVSAIFGGLVALLPVTASVHYANEYADYEADALSERTAFSGGSGALHDLDLPRSLAGRATAISGVATLPAAGVAWALGVPPRALALLAVILVGGWQYSLGPLALSWHGLGVPTNALVGALLLPVYGAAVVAPPSAATILPVVPFTLVTTLSLLATQWPDREADAQVGKRTLTTRVSPGRLRWLFRAGVVAYPLVVVAVYWLVGLPIPVILAHVAVLPLLAWATRTFTRRRSPLPAVSAMVGLAVASTLAWGCVVVIEWIEVTRLLEMTQW